MTLEDSQAEGERENDPVVAAQRAIRRIEGRISTVSEHRDKAKTEADKLTYINAITGLENQIEEIKRKFNL